MARVSFDVTPIGVSLTLTIDSIREVETIEEALEHTARYLGRVPRRSFEPEVYTGRPCPVCDGSGRDGPAPSEDPCPGCSASGALSLVEPDPYDDPFHEPGR